MATLILIPGLAGNEAMWCGPQLALAPWRPVITDVHTREPGIAQMAAALLREHQGPLVLCGTSMGGMIAMEAARQSPARVHGLALLGTDARPDAPEMVAIRKSAIALFAKGRVREVVAPNIAYAFHPDNAQRLGDSYLEFVLSAGAEQLIAQNRAVIARPDAREHLPRLQCPVLVVCGEADRLTPPERSREIASLVPQAKLVILPGCGHLLTMEQPEVVGRLLVEWLSGVNPAPGCAPFPPAFAAR